MRLRITEDARKYVHAKGYDSITIESIPRRSCCTVDYTSKVKLGRPRKNYGYEKQRTLDIDVHFRFYYGSRITSGSDGETGGYETQETPGS